METLAVIVIDPDQEFLKSISEDPKAKIIQPVTASDWKSGQIKIAEHKGSLLAIVINTKIKEPHGLPVIRFAKHQRPATPIYLTYDDDADKPADEVLANLKIETLIKKPLPWKDFVALLSTPIFDADRAKAIADADATPMDGEVNAKDADFLPIRAKDFIAGSKSYFDIFVRLGDNRYLKLLRAGDAFERDRLQKYLDKKVANFHVKKEAQELYLQYCDQLTEKLLKNEKIDTNFKVSQLSNTGDQTAIFLKNAGISQPALQSARRFATQACSMVRQLDLKKSDQLRGYMEQVINSEHSVGMVMFISLLLEPLGFSDPKVIETISVAGLLHDIGLKDMPEKFAEEDEKNLTEEELLEFHKHPQIGAELLRKIPHINPLIPQIVLQHHERRSRKGFPSRLGAGSINLVSELIGLADEFNLLMRRAAKNPDIDPIRIIAFEFSNNFSARLIEAFRSVFPLPKD